MGTEYTSNIRAVLYTAACLTVPAVWAVIMFKAFELVRRSTPSSSSAAPSAKSGGKKADKDPPMDYMI